ncbi:MAG: GlxA family transcriptional regulator, partial [Pseudomonadota bacterium]
MTERSVQTIEVADIQKPRRFVFVLLDQFTLLCYACAVESLRIA